MSLPHGRSEICHDTSGGIGKLIILLFNDCLPMFKMILTVDPFRSIIAYVQLMMLYYEDTLLDSQTGGLECLVSNPSLKLN